ncbi:glycosyltransferase family 2 protein [Desulfobacula sp.]|uniref:glycosyltransferase family 2 protein n=1 Tax=Desulfobacula sp. TaxID=2593537 RepID=UPI0026393510|nr:glycosyltransferase family 2 protein [Desulfobacula sp.]
MENVVKISIITVCFNSLNYIDCCIKSILSQTYDHIEYIIIDGGSDDGTKDIIKKYDYEIDKWISEPDNGIADAMNKGIKLATGDYILFIHSDDYLADSMVIEKAVSKITIPFDIFLFDIIQEKNGIKTLCAPKGFIWWTNFKTTVFHQACFCSKKLFEKIGVFDKKFQITMDFDFFLRAYRVGVRFTYIKFPLSVMRLVGISSRLDWNSLKMRFSEERKVHIKNCPNLWMKIIYRVYWFLYLPYRKVKFLLNEYIFLYLKN